MNKIPLNVTQVGDVFEAKADGWCIVGRGSSFREAIGDWVYLNSMSTNVAIGGPVFQVAYPPAQRNEQLPA